MKYLKYLILIAILLTGCEQQVLEIEPTDEALYADMEIGVNYTDYVRTQYKRSKIHDTLYTHKVDYLIPLVFYYIPMNHNFDTADAWTAYFDDWKTATRESSYEVIEPYVKNTYVEGYVRDRFTEEPLMPIVSLLIEENEDIFIDGFKTYKRKEWPEVQEVLYGRVKYINEALRSQRIAMKWQEKTGFSLDDYKISLSYYENRDIDSVSISHYKSVMHYMPRLDVSEVVEVMSLSYGDNLIKIYVQRLIKEYMVTYHYLDEPVYEYLTDITEEIIHSYNTELFGIEHETYIELPPIVTNAQGISKAMPYFKKAFTWYLEDKKKENPYIVDEELHYQGTIYNSRIINEDVTLYYKHQYPIVIRNASGIHILTNEMDTVPEVSPSGTRLLFISPYAFEHVGSLYMYDVETTELVKLVNKPTMDENTVKACKWYDDDSILYIDGFSHGTVTRGGSLKKYDLKAGKSEILVEPKEGHEVSDIYYKDGQWIYELTIFDKDYQNYAIQYKVLNID